MKPKILTTLELPKNALDALEKYFIVEGGPELVKDRNKLLKLLEDKVGLLTAPHIKVDRELFDHAPNLMVVSTYSVGFDHIDVNEATRRGIYIGYTPGVLSDCVAEVTWALILSTYKRISEAERIVRARKWVKGIYKEPLGRDLKGKTLGIIGLGRIGRRVAEIGRCFGMRIVYYDIVKPPEAEKLDFEYCDLETLLKISDVVSIHVPLLKETYHLIDESKLKLMKKDAIIVNTSRGAVIDEKALIRALKEGWIMGAGLDVFEQEPLPLDSELLDVGCGTCILFENLYDEDKIFVGVDISEKILRIGWIKFRDKINLFLVLADAEHLPFRDKVFDTIFSITLIQNLPNPLRSLEEIKRVSNREAAIVVSGLKRKYTFKEFNTIIKNVVSLRESYDVEDLKDYIAFSIS